VKLPAEIFTRGINTEKNAPESPAHGEILEEYIILKVIAQVSTGLLHLLYPKKSGLLFRSWRPGG